MAYTAAKAVYSQVELNRFAAAFLNTRDIHQAVDWDAAAQQFDPTVKTASFNTVTLRAMKKAVAAGDKGVNGEGMGKEGGKSRATLVWLESSFCDGKGGRKRKAADEGEAKTGKWKGGKKAKTVQAEPEHVAEEENGEEDADQADGDKVKSENYDEGDAF